MKTGLTIQQMAQELLRQSKAKQDYLVNTGSLSLSVTTDAPQLRVTENGLDKIAPLDIRQTAHRQLGTYLGIPQKYYELMRTDAPELLAYNANYWFSQKNELRTLRTMDGCARAFLSNRYDRTSGALSLFYNWGRHKIDDGYAAGSEPLDYRFNSRDRMLGVSWYQSAQLFAGNRLTVGFDYFHFGGESWNRFLDGHEEPQVDKTQDEVAGYVDFRQSLGTWLTLDAGLRVDRHSHVGTEWVPQAGVSFHLPRSAEIKLSAGKGFRYPTIRELYMFRPANPDLRPERLWSYELSLSQRLWEGRLSYGVNLFYIDGENLILRMPVDGRQMNVNTGRIENAGVEAEIAYRISAAWSVDANYSFLHMEHPVLAAPEHKLHVGASFTQGRWSVSTGLQYVEGLYTSIVVGGTGSDAQENFILWNLRAGFRISRKLRIFVDGENLLAQRYEINAGFPMPRATVLGGLDMHF